VKIKAGGDEGKGRIPAFNARSSQLPSLRLKPVRASLASRFLGFPTIPWTILTQFQSHPRAARRAWKQG
jgi:hypothetical protein